MTSNADPSPPSPPLRLRIAIAIASVGRPKVLAEVAPHWLNQTRAPDAVVVVAVSEADVHDLAQTFPALEVRFGAKGLPAQRNAALDVLKERADIVVFFDDDFVPSKRFLENLETLLHQQKGLAIITGDVLADGIMGPGLTYQEAADRVNAYDAEPRRVDFSVHPTRNAYGCNMVVHVRLAPDERFDEHLPLYAWLEDVDFSIRMGAYGRVVKTMALAGVHMGAKVGRTPGKRMGYSQIANPAYLVRKKTLPLLDAMMQAGRNVLKNLLWSIRPEPWVDRRGRLHGNLLGLWDVLRGRADPNRMLSL